jgi:hypothetical protein
MVHGWTRRERDTASLSRRDDSGGVRGSQCSRPSNPNRAQHTMRTIARNQLIKLTQKQSIQSVANILPRHLTAGVDALTVNPLDR